MERIGLKGRAKKGRHLLSMSKSRTRSFVSSVPFRLPTAQTSRVSSARILHSTPPLPPLSRDTKFRMNSPANENMLRSRATRQIFFHLPVLTSQSLTVPSSEEVITNLLLNCKHVTADWCLLAPRIFREFITFSYLSNCPLFFNRCKFLFIRSFANKNGTIGILTK